MSVATLTLESRRYINGEGEIRIEEQYKLQVEVKQKKLEQHMEVWDTKTKNPS